MKSSEKFGIKGGGEEFALQKWEKPPNFEFSPAPFGDEKCQYGADESSSVCI